MSVMVSNKHMYVQFIDDERQHTLAYASTISLQNNGPNITKAHELGKVAAQNAKEAGIERVVVDRGGFRYHGRVKAIVEAAAENGIGVGRTITQASEATQDEDKRDKRIEDSAVDPADGEDGPADSAESSNDSSEEPIEPADDTAEGPNEEEKT
jgi:large subunit ribosomal protein L18